MLFEYSTLRLIVCIYYNSAIFISEKLLVLDFQAVAG